MVPNLVTRFDEGDIFPGDHIVQLSLDIAPRDTFETKRKIAVEIFVNDDLLVLNADWTQPFMCR